MKKIINENQRGLLFTNGKFIKMLEPGKYFMMCGKSIEVVSINVPLACAKCSLETLLKDSTIASNVTTIEINNHQLGLHFCNGLFIDFLKPGKYAFWSEMGKHDFMIEDISNPEISKNVPKQILRKKQDLFEEFASEKYFSKFEVYENQKGILYFDNNFIRVLDSGAYYFWDSEVEVKVIEVDTRLLKMDISGQEILTQDKVMLRINFVCSYRISDYVKAITEIDDYKVQLYDAAQLAIREYIGKYKIDELLESKNQISEYVLRALKAKEDDFYVKIFDAGIKDIILPGEIRDIMNTVLIAEKRAQANVITRREEVASTRSLLNTAKLMEENQTLFRLKELEFIEKICTNIDSINVIGNGDILSQLAAAIKKS